jgi:hypothetical protein
MRDPIPRSNRCSRRVNSESTYARASGLSSFSRGRTPERIGVINSAPASLTVKRRKYDIEIRFSKGDFGQENYLDHSGLSSMVAGNVAADLILTADISSIVNSATLAGALVF